MSSRHRSCDNFPASYMQPRCVAPFPLKKEVAVTNASLVSSVVHDNAVCDTGWNQDMGRYPAHSAMWDDQVAWCSTFLRPEPFMRLFIQQAVQVPILNNTGDKQRTSVAPSHFEHDEATSIASTVSTPKGPTHNTSTDKQCPICPASLGRLQDRKRHILSHLPHWLQCQAPDCSWRGDRWEHLRKHRLNISIFTIFFLALARACAILHNIAQALKAR